MSRTTVGIIANPAAGKDIRRLVSEGRFVSNNEKINIIRRILAGMDAIGIDRALIMPDPSNIGLAALDGAALDFETRLLDMPVFGTEADSTGAARRMVDAGAGCLVTLGGDGTCRSVAKEAGPVPMVAISTGTNNVFPELVEGTSAGMAAAVVARGLVDAASVSTVSKLLEVTAGGLEPSRDTALVDVAASRQRYVGARAVWDTSGVRELVLSLAIPGSVGLSAIGAAVCPLTASQDMGLHVRLGPGGATVMAPITPGVVAPVEVCGWRALSMGEAVEIGPEPGTVALDGERSFSVAEGQAVRVTLTRNGPRLVSVHEALRRATLAGVFTSGVPEPMPAPVGLPANGG